MFRDSDSDSKAEDEEDEAESDKTEKQYQMTLSQYGQTEAVVRRLEGLTVTQKKKKAAK